MDRNHYSLLSLNRNIFSRNRGHALCKLFTKHEKFLAYSCFKHSTVEDKILPSECGPSELAGPCRIPALYCILYFSSRYTMYVLLKMSIFLTSTDFGRISAYLDRPFYTTKTFNKWSRKLFYQQTGLLYSTIFTPNVMKVKFFKQIGKNSNLL